MKRLYAFTIATLILFSANAQERNSILFSAPPAAPLPVKHLVAHPPYATGPQNGHIARRQTSGVASYSDWYDLWDEMYDTTSTTLTHSYLYSWDIYPDSNLYDATGFYPPYNVFTHGMGMSFDPSDSAYYYHAYDTSYRVSAPLPFTISYKLDSFWVPGEYARYDTTSGNVDSLIVEFLVSQDGAAPPDSGEYALIFNPAKPWYFPCSADETPRFVSPRYFRATDDCISPGMTTVIHQRYAFPLTIFDAFIYKQVKFALSPAITVRPGKYLAAYVYFKSQVAYPLGTNVNDANYYWLYAGEPTGLNVWFPQSAHNTATGYPGSHQDGLIATNQITYSDTGFTYNGHDILLPSYAYANSGANLSPGFDVPEMAFHITWTDPDISLSAGNMIRSSPEIHAYPNPASDVLNVVFTMDRESDVKISLIDVIGETVASRDMGIVGRGAAVFNITNLPDGAYTYLLQAGQVRSTGQVVIMH